MKKNTFKLFEAFTDMSADLSADKQKKAAEQVKDSSNTKSKPVAASDDDDLVAPKPVAAGDDDDLVAQKPVAAGDDDDLVAPKPVAAGDDDELVKSKPDKKPKSGKISAAVRRCKNRIHFPCPKDDVFKYGCIDPNDQGSVGMIQRCLMQVGDGNDELPIYGDDGRFCAETKKAVQKFQSRNSLPETGEVDKATSDMLFKKCKSSIVKDKEPDKKSSGDAPGGVGKGSFTYTGSGWENTVIGTGLGTLTAVSSGIAMKDDEPNVVIKTVDDIKKTNKYKDLKKVSVGIEKGEGAKKSHAGEIKKDFEGFTEELFEKIEDYNKDSSKLKELNSFLKEELEAEKQKTTPDDETIEYNRKKVIFIEYLLKKYSISESKINKNFISHIKNRNDMLEKLIFERLVKNANRLR